MTRYSTKGHIIVVGAGVIGLQTAVSLLEAGYGVTIVAEQWPDQAGSMEDPSWASPWAGAQWRVHAAADSEAAAWETRTYEAWTKLTAEEAAAGHQPGQGPSSLASMPFEHYWHQNTKPTPPPPWWASISPSTFQELSPADLPPGMAYGVRMRSFTLEPRRYLNNLLSHFRSQGGTTVKARVNPISINESAHDGHSAVSLFLRAVTTLLPSGEPVVAYINATGLAAGKLVDDPRMIPNRGQTMLVRGEARSMRTTIGAKPTDVLAIIPRPGTGTTIVGSTRGIGNADYSPSEDDCQWLLREGSALAPELIAANTGELGIRNDFGFTVLGANVGIRPRREGGPRVEREEVDGKVMIHAYGHDGAGYQQSLGTAEQVLRLIEGES